MITTNEVCNWLPINELEAVIRFKNKVNNLYVVCDDGEFWKIESMEELSESVKYGCTICIDNGNEVV